MCYELVLKKYTGHVALAGQNGGAIGFALIFLLTFFIKKKSKKEFRIDLLRSTASPATLRL